MDKLSPADFENLIGTQITIDNPDDDLEPHTLTIADVEVLMENDDERRNPFAVIFHGSAMVDSRGEQALQGAFTVQGGVLDGEMVFLTVNGLAPDDVETYEYEAVFS